jgi:hypothetical protein
MRTSCKFQLSMRSILMIESTFKTLVETVRVCLIMFYSDREYSGNEQSHLP